MNIIDAIIIVMLLLWTSVGFKRGVFKETILVVGMILVLVVSYKFKNMIGDFLVLNLPFFNFDFYGGASTLNIILYQTLAFLLVASVLLIIFRILVAITGIFEKILRFTIILGIPSKLLGAVVGFIEGYVIIFCVLFAINQPVFNIDKLNESKYAPTILNKSPVLSKMAKNSLDTVTEIYELTNIQDSNTLNLEILDIILEKNVTSVSVVRQLVEKDKLQIQNIDSVLNKYK